MDNQRISLKDNCCVACFLAATPSADGILVLLPQDEPRHLRNFSVYDFARQKAFLLHKECYCFLEKRLGERIGQDVLWRRLNLLAETLSFLYPACSRMEQRRADRIASHCFTNTGDLQRPSQTPWHTSLSGLPWELQEAIVSYTSPSPFAKMCCLLGVAEELLNLRQPDLQGNAIRDTELVSFRTLLGQPYVSHVKLHRNSTDGRELAPIVQAFDDVTCIGVGTLDSLPRRRKSSNLWYRKVPGKTVTKTTKKGISLNYVNSTNRVCLWSLPDYQDPQPESSFNFPLGHSHSAAGEQSPILIRSLDMKGADGITVASRAGSTQALLVHPSKQALFYQEQCGALSDLVWQYFPLNPGFYLANVAVRYDSRAPSRLRCPCVAFVLAHQESGEQMVMETGWHIPESYRKMYTFRSLADQEKATEIVRIHVNDQNAADRELRIGVQAQEAQYAVSSSTRSALCDSVERAPYPTVPCPKGIPMRDLLWSRIDTSKYTSFQKCIAKVDGSHHCIGLMFQPGSVILGQWRVDFAERDAISLPTRLLLCNVTIGDHQHVKLVEEGTWGCCVPVEGALEWWCSSRTSMVERSL